MTIKEITLHNEERALEAINNAYISAIETLEKDIAAIETALDFTTNGKTNSALRALRIANRMILDMMDDHIIEDIEFKGTFIPHYDWITFNLDYINDTNERLHEDDHKYFSIDDFLIELSILEEANIILDYKCYGSSPNQAIFDFTIKDFTCKELQLFETNYTRLKDALEFFHNY